MFRTSRKVRVQQNTQLQQPQQQPQQVHDELNELPLPSKPMQLNAIQKQFFDDINAEDFPTTIPTEYIDSSKSVHCLTTLLLLLQLQVIRLDIFFHINRVIIGQVNQ